MKSVSDLDAVDEARIVQYCFTVGTVLFLVIVGVSFGLWALAGAFGAVLCAATAMVAMHARYLIDHEESR